MKQSPLRADPAAVRDWQDRSRQRARDRVRAVPQPGQAIPDGQTSRAEGQRPVQFRAPSPPSKRWCARCARHGRRRRAATFHHWLPQQQIRVYVRGLRLPEDEKRRTVRRLIHDPRNFSALCDECHGHRGTQHAANLTLDDVPRAAFEFASELGLEWVERLRRAYDREPAPDAWGWPA